MASKADGFAMGIPNETSKKKATNLQEAFEKFRKGRQREIKMAKVMEERALSQRKDEARMEMLRNKFMEGVKKYYGVPYAKRCHDEHSPYHNAPLFLDCCGLVRRALLDLKQEFGFKVRGGNQTYMYDTLPLDIKEEEMKPGDLVFISATYYQKPGKKWRKQRHDMVHVEVWAGDGEKTIGARWQKGLVQMFDSYKFVSKSYYDMKFHFKSIDTWLMGICKSFCAEHPWRSSKYDPGKKSIFSEKDSDEEECQAAQEEDDDCPQQEDCNLKQSEGSVEKCDSETTSNEDKSDVSQTGTNEIGFSQTVLIPSCMEKGNAKDTCMICSKNNEKLTSEDAEMLAQKNDMEENQKNGHETVYGSEKRELDIKNNQEINYNSNNCENPTCLCPECSPSYVYRRTCVHTQTMQDNAESSLDLTASKEITTSLECFEVIVSPDYREEVEQAVLSCPRAKSQQNGTHGGNSPSNEEKPRQDSDGSPSNNDKPKKNKDSPSKPFRDGARSRMLHVDRRQPAFYVSPGNGSSMVEATLVSLGWRKLEDRHDYSFKLKWVECKSQIDYKNLREGDQLVNHISNIGLLTTKLGLLCSLEEYERVLDKVGSKQRIQLSEFVPETEKLTNMTEKLRFVNEVYKEGEVWICKPVGQNQGKGIYMINSLAKLRDKLHLNIDPSTASNGRRTSQFRPSLGRIIQRYITNPLLLNGFKFDVRAYMFIASTNPYVVLYHHGYIRLSCVPYSPYSEEAGNSILTAHLTNQYIQKKHPLYSSMKDDTVWSYEHIQSYIDEHHTKDKGLPENWMFTTFTKRMHQIMLTCFHSVRKKLHRKVGFFDLLGFDFMVDENFKVWLIEVNVNPSLNTNCQVLKEVIPDMVGSTIKIALEIFEKSKKRRPVFPLENLGGFAVLYNGEGKS